MIRNVHRPRAAERERQRGLAPQEPDREDQAHAADADRDDRVVGARVAREVAQRVADPPVAAELARHLAGRGERVERLARDDRVGQHPQHRRGDDEREQLQRLRARQLAGEPEPVDAAEQPRLRPQQAGEHEQREDGPAGARAAQLEQGRGEDHQVEGQVEHRPQREQLHVRAGQQHGDGDEGDRPSQQPLREGEHDGEEADVAEQRDEHQDAVAGRAERRHRPGHQRRERVRRGRAEHVVVRQVAVEELLAPDQRVVRVVVRIRLPDDEDHERRDDARGEQQHLGARPGAARRVGLRRLGPRRVGLRHGHRRRLTLAGSRLSRDRSPRGGGSRPPARGARRRAARS